MRCQARNRRSSSPLCFQRPASFPFHHPHPAAHCTSSYPEDSSHLSLRKTFLHCLHDSPAKIFLSLRRQRASILVPMPDTLTHYFLNVTYIMLRLVILSTLYPVLPPYVGQPTVEEGLPSDMYRTEVSYDEASSSRGRQ